MFMRAVVQEGIADGAILVPQQGVSRNPKGEPVALIVDQTGTVQQRLLHLGRTIEDKWLVSSGISAGDRVIVEGTLNVRPGATVKAVPLSSAKSGGETRNIESIKAESK
jgi:membrane fusion protein (multidrug efflux system)